MTTKICKIPTSIKIGYKDYKLEEWNQLVKNTSYGTKTEEVKLKNTIRKKVGQNVGIKDAMSTIEIK